MQNLFEIVREAEDNYLHYTAELGEYVEWDMHDTIETIDAYLNSKHISGSEDSLGRPKPFFNIVTAAANIWYRATDIDRKDIRILPDKAQNTALAFVATVLLQNWMKKTRFGQFLNEWGRTLARYGSAVVKFVERDGELIATVVPWNRLIVDPIDFDATPRIEKFYKTPGQLRNMATPGHPDYAGYDLEKVEGLVSAIATRKTLDGKTKDNNTNFVELYEVHDLLPDYLLIDEEPEDEDDTKYVQQMHVISYVESGVKGEYEDYCLYKGREKKDPYMITHLIKEDGRTLAIGAVESLFTAQWMTNHSMKNQKDTLDLASKLIFQTADTKFQGQNVLTAIETGDIFVHGENKPLTRVANDKPDIQAFQGFAQQWQSLAQEITSTPDAIRGVTLPSGTPYSLGAFLGAQANSLFEIMTENKGLHLEDMLREWIIPNLMKKMNTKDEIVGVLEDHEIQEIDAMYVPKEAVRRYNERIKKELLKEEPDMAVISPYMQEMEEMQVKGELGPLGNRRFFKPDEIGDKTWKEALKDFEWEVTIEVTNENTDKQAVLTTLASLLQTIAANPAILQDPNAKAIFSKIISETGVISPIQITPSVPAPQASPPQGGGTEALAEITAPNGTA